MKLKALDKNIINYEKIIKSNEIFLKVFKKNSIKSFIMNNKIN